ncbi:MAG TPA: AI-2E family transporter [Longimicrobiaceae bacterium]|nr:AI-2E family transporter [Longimicrobiaceae bacterium]
MPAAATTSHGHPTRPHAAAMLLLGTAAAAFLYALFPYVPGLLGAAVLFVVAEPIHRRVRRRVGSRTAAVLLAAAVVVMLLIPGTWLVTTAIGEATEALRSFQRSHVLERLSAARVSGVDLRQHVATGVGTLVTWLSGQAVSLVGGATLAALNTMVALFGMYYLLTGARGPWGRVRHLLGLPPALSDAVGTRFVEVTEAMLLGTLLTAVLQGTLVGGAFALLGIRGAVLWGLVTACASVLPVFGSALVWLPAAALLALEHRYGGAAVMLVVGGGLASNLDNVVRLVVYRRVSGIHPMITLVGALAGMRVFGLAGVLIGPLGLSYFLQMLHAVLEHSTPPGAAGGPGSPPAPLPAAARVRAAAPSRVPSSYISGGVG